MNIKGRATPEPPDVVDICVDRPGWAWKLRSRTMKEWDRPSLWRMCVRSPCCCNGAIRPSYTGHGGGTDPPEREARHGMGWTRRAGWGPASPEEREYVS